MLVANEIMQGIQQFHKETKFGSHDILSKYSMIDNFTEYVMGFEFCQKNILKP